MIGCENYKAIIEYFKYWFNNFDDCIGSITLMIVLVQ